MLLAIREKQEPGQPLTFSFTEVPRAPGPGQKKEPGYYSRYSKKKNVKRRRKR